MLVANFHWVDPHTTTDIMYSYSVPFTVKSNGDLASFGDLEGAAIGQAGLNFDGCVEARDFSMTWDFEMLGRKTKVAIDQVDPGLLLTAPDLVESDQMTVFDLTLANPQVTSFALEPFSTCFPGMGEEELGPLLKFWLDVIPTLPAVYHLVPADTGTFCTEPISYIEDGLGEMIPCYSISQP